MQKRTMFHIFVLIIGFPFLVAECPTNSQKWMDKCFYFISKPVSFNDANLECKNAYNGNLVSIHDGFTNSWINTQANNFFHNSSTSELWIGANGTSSSWTWTDGSASDFSDWGHQASYGNCGAMNSVNGLWNWENCSGARPFVCETDSTTTTTTTPSTQACPSDWFYFSETNSCYYWTEKFTWSEAENFCVSQSSHLASIHSFSELNFTQTIFNGNLWIGLHGDSAPVKWNTVWQWTDGSKIDYANWWGYMPGKFNPEPCVMVSTHIIGFENNNCTLIKYALCKKPSNIILPTPKPSKPTHRDCFEGWTYFEPTNSCYLFKTANATTHEKAEEFCVQKGGHLASIHSIDELNFVKTFANIYPWIGLYTNDTSVVWNSTWYWTDGSKFDYKNWGFIDFPYLDKETCAYLTVDGFHNVDCELISPFAVCKRHSNNTAVTTSIPSPTISNIHCLNGSLYDPYTQSCYFFSNAAFNWSSAEDYCAYKGGHLASFHSVDEAQFLNSYEFVWIGLYTNDSTVEWNSTWFWTDNSQVDYLKWYGGMPYLYAATCGNFHSNGFFDNENCSNLHYALCKTPSLIIEPTPAVIPTSSGPIPACPDGWKLYEAKNYCFTLAHNQPNWTAYEYYCAYNGGHLASIHDSEEFAFVENLCDYSTCWIGLYSDDMITWKWRDDTVFDFQNWMPNNPNTNGSNCAIIEYGHKGFSNRYPCDHYLQGVCKRKAYKKP